VSKEYALIDCGLGEKLERFGTRTLVRPGSACIWKKHLGPKSWQNADAIFDPKRGWHLPRERFESWQINFSGCTLELRLQTNGQVGLFPEHGLYLKEIEKTINSLKAADPGQPIRMLNLCAYTGLATVFCAKQGVQVTHVDLSKKALAWANRNIQLNRVPPSKIRLICDESIKFLQRELGRKNHYEIILMDPPSFSRTSKSDYWKLEDILPQAVKDLQALSNPKAGLLVITCHHPAIGSETLANLLSDIRPGRDYHIKHQSLFLKEEDSERLLPAGSLALLQWRR